MSPVRKKSLSVEQDIITLLRPRNVLIGLLCAVLVVIFTFVVPFILLALSHFGL